jgi:VWFA-related protein
MPLTNRFPALILTAFLSLICSGRANQLTQSPAITPAPQSQSNTVASPSELISMDFIALGKDGTPVTDLKSDEFRLLLDKTEQPIKQLSSAVREPLVIGLLFDISGSRRSDTHVANETKLASEFLHAIWRDGYSGFVLIFNHEVYPLAQPTGNLAELDQALKRVTEVPYKGPTSVYDAICSIKSENFAASTARKVFIVFSDFEDNSSRISSEHALEYVRHAGVSIFPVILSDGFGALDNKKGKAQGKRQGKLFADASGGEVFIPESEKQLPSLFQYIAAELQATYRLTYQRSLDPTPNTSKKPRVNLETTRPHLTLLYPKS